MSHERVAVVTGSTRGIGLGLARELHARGCRVVVSGRDASTVAEVAAGMSGDDDVLGVNCDVAKRADVTALWDSAVAAFGQVDIWVNNAGTTTSPLPFWQLPMEQFQTTIRTNVLGVMNGTAVALAGMRGQPGGGHIFNLEGMGSKGEVQPGVISYGTSKAAVGYLDRALRHELRGGPVSVSSIRPGINVTNHLLHDAHLLPADRWRRTKRIFNILGDRPETTTPWIAERILAARGPTRIVWLSNRKIAWRFATAGFRHRDLIDNELLP